MMTDMVVQCLLMKGGVGVRTVTVALGGTRQGIFRVTGGITRKGNANGRAIY